MNPTATPAIPFGRLLAVETRKLFDTRSSKVIAAVLVAVTVAAIAARGLYSGPELYGMVTVSGIGYGTLLPVIAILAVTAEWSHRTAMTTFTLEPRRGRVLAAKFVPPLVTGVLAPLVAVVVALPVTAAVAALQDTPADWRLTPPALLGHVATDVVMVAHGLALGTLLLNAPAAIVLFLVMPMLWSLLATLGGTVGSVAGWLDLGAVTGPLSAGDMTGGDAVRLAVAAAVWIAVPMAAGAFRVLRKDIS